jgi:polar amino acid transport system substrate-binding protein
MTTTRFKSCLPWLALCLFAVHVNTLAARVPRSGIAISICDDENEWPPYSYYQRVGGKKTANLTGFAVAVINDIFSRRGVDYNIDLIPWPRCLAVTTLGKDYGMVLNMSYNAERAKSFFFSRPYYATTAYYYYSRRNHPGGLPVATAADISKYRVCGVQGYNYEGYGLGPGEVDQGAKDFVALISKVQLGRCALFMEKDEVMMGYAAIGKNYLADPDIGKAPIPGLKPMLFYFGISKRYSHAEEVHAMIDEELQQMESNGRLAELWRKAIPGSTRQ